MVCDVCMGSHDFLCAYQLHTTPIPVQKEEQNPSPSGKTSPRESPSLEVAGANEASGTSSKIGSEPDSAGSGCELARRRAIANHHSVSNSNNQGEGAGFFTKNWRSQLCRCTTCKVRHYLLDQYSSTVKYRGFRPLLGLGGPVKVA